MSAAGLLLIVRVIRSLGVAQRTPAATRFGPVK